MKAWNKELVLWGLGAAFGEAVLGAVLVEMALSVAGRYPTDRFVWFFPLGLFPVLLVVVVVNVMIAKQRATRLLMFKYLTFYLTGMAGYVWVMAHGSMWWQLIVGLGTLPLQIWIPFRWSKKLQLAAQQAEQQPIPA
jgi:TctA family transporter